MPSNVGSSGVVSGAGNANLNAVGSGYAQRTGKPVTDLLSRYGKKKKKKGLTYSITKAK